MSKPEDALLAKLSQLSPAQREALLKKLKQQKSEKGGSLRPPEQAIVPIARDQHYPLSYAQQRLWFLEQLYPGSAAYNIAAAVELTGNLNTALLEQSFQRIIQRHDSLRTGFTTEHTGARQHIQSKTVWQMPVSDISADQLTTQLEQDAGQGFDLTNPPLLRARLYRLSPRQYVLSIVMHHIIADAWSTQILLNEASHIYSALAQGATPVLPMPRIQYIDYAQWQKDWLQQPYCQQQRTFWQEKLRHTGNLQLASDKPRPVIMSQNGASEHLQLDKQLTQRFQSLCQQQGATVFNGLLSVFQCLLYRYTRQQDFCIGTPVAGRIHSDTEALIGFFVNTLALPCDISHGDSFSQLIRKVRKTTIEAQDKQDVPFEQLVELLPAERDSSHTPVFQVFFSYNPCNRDQSVQLPGISARFIDVDTHTAKFDLSLVVDDRDDSLHCQFEYNTDLFEKGTVQRLAHHFNRLLHSICDQPDVAIEALPMLDREETRHLLQAHSDVQWRDTSIAALFEQQAANQPQHTAVVQGNTSLTFRQLNRQANQLAHWLQQQGVGSGDFVGLCYPPCIELSIALLAVIKTGAAYIPLDPSYPAERLNFMLDNAGIRILLTTHRAALPGVVADQIVTTDTLALQQQPDSNPGTAIDAAQPLYAIYTSGSTGTPKAAMISHRNEVNLLSWYSRHYRMNHEDRFLVFSAIGFDLTQKNLLAPLCLGAQLHFSVSEHYEPQALLHTIEQQQISWINCAPSAFYPLVDQPQLHKLTSLRKLFFGGEPIRIDHLQPWLDSVHCHASITNMYGPTECTDIATSHTLVDPAQHKGSVPIGTPADGVQLYVLDNDMNLLPQGAIGELYIGGLGVGLGYLNNPDMTGQHFVANPFCQGERIYKTGDLVRYNQHGELLFNGRADDQLKIRGFRIEPAEIEAQLRSLPGISKAVVAVRSINEQPQLLAWLCSEQPLAESHEYRRQLQQQLPDYMIPVAYSRISDIPLSPNGKVDRKRLPAIDITQIRASNAYLAPGNATEETLAAIWQDVLGVEKAGIRDNFFELGGNSLSATQVITRIRQQFSLDLPLRTLFEVSTIEGLAEIIMAMSSTGNNQPDEAFEEGTL